MKVKIHASDPLALYATTLRVARKLERPELARLTGIALSTIKNVEAGRACSIVTITDVYRKGLTGAHALAAHEWHQLLAYWIDRACPGTSALEIGAGLKAAAESQNTVHGRRTAAYAHALRVLPDADALTLESLTALAGTAKSAPVFALLRAALALAKSR